uniref:Uncharacterized protein n=1 Tax=Spongospora subterranea TaxID=70186 RepID=A0A0H5QX61_9EUKA|eukprot:CRZ06312.1 hypothetical protein [Spongospora subterranea]
MEVLGSEVIGAPQSNLAKAESPSWGSDVYKQVVEIVQKKEKKLDKYNGNLKKSEERIRVLQDHLKNVREEVQRTQDLLDAKAKAIESEDHLKRLAERELSRLRTDVITFEKEASGANEVIHSMQNEMFAAQERIDKFLIQKNWNEEELEQWSLAVKQSEDDAIALSRYCRKDDVILKSGTMKIGHLTKVLFLPH